MINLNDYIKTRIDKFCKVYFDPNSRALNCLQDKNVKHNKWQYNNVSSSWNKINSNEDVQYCLNGVINRISQYEKMIEEDKKLYPIDYFDIYLSMYKLIYALQKVASCFDNDLCNFKYTLNDIDKIFNVLEESTEQFKKIAMINACRD